MSRRSIPLRRLVRSHPQLELLFNLSWQPGWQGSVNQAIPKETRTMQRLTPSAALEFDSQRGQTEPGRE